MKTIDLFDYNSSLNKKKFKVILAEIDKSLILTGIMRSHRCWDWCGACAVVVSQFGNQLTGGGGGQATVSFPCQSVSVEQTTVLSGGVQ